MRDTWANVLATKTWGGDICARIRGRKDLGREPTTAEVDGLLESGRYKLTTPQEVMAALDAGTEVPSLNIVIVRSLTMTIQRLTVWTLKCVGYDNDFQRQLSEKFPVWKQQQQKIEQKPAQQRNGVSRGRKRKRADTQSDTEETELDRWIWKMLNDGHTEIRVPPGVTCEQMTASISYIVRRDPKLLAGLVRKV